MFFGSAMTNFGVRPFLDAFLELAPPPSGRPSSRGLHRADPGEVLGLHLQDPGEHGPLAPRPHRVPARGVGALREGHERVPHAPGQEGALAKPTQFMASERTAIDDAYPGDVIGLFDPGQYRIGDTLVEGGKFDFECVPRFSPEHFAVVRTRDPLKRKQMEKGLEQLAEEGTIQIFQQLQMGMKDPIVGVVGQLQFEVLQYRMEHEYGANILLDKLPYGHARWVVGAKFDAQELRLGRQPPDGAGPRRRPLVLFRDDWALQHAEEKHPELTFLAHAPQLKASSVVVMS